MRYLVTRLEADYNPTEYVDGYGLIPQDIKRLIDRAHDSAGKTGRFVLDEPWNSDGPYGGGQFDMAADSLGGIVDPALVVHDGNRTGELSPQCMLTGYNDTAGRHLFNDSTGVMGYMSFGMHDTDIWQQTLWGRPTFNWQPGGVALVSESFSAQYLRASGFGYFPTNSEAAGSVVVLSWSRNERSLAYGITRVDGSGIAELHVISIADSGAAKQGRLLDDSGRSPSFSPDGKLIAYVQDLNGFNIYVISLQGRGKRLVITNGHSPDW